MIIQASQAFTALQTIEDILVNNPMASNFRSAYIVDYGFTQSATGIVLDLKVGMNFVFTGVNPSLQNRVPIYPDDFLGRFGVLPGDRIILKGVETSNNARTLYYCFRFTPIGMRR